MLKTGEEMEAVLVMPPEDDYRNRIISLLGHKGQPWLYHVEHAFAGNVRGLETRFYVGLLGDEPICNMMTAEHNRVGILGHVYTKPEHRRKGACALLMERQMEEWRQRDGGLLLLLTEDDSPAYWIYHRFGFRDVIRGSGFMQCSTEDDFLEKHFSPCTVRIVDCDWSAWPRLNLLCASLEGDILRSVAFARFAPGSFEESGLCLKKRLDHEPRTRAKLLESETGAIVGWAFVLPDDRWPGLNLLDFFLHPHFAEHASCLLRALELPAGKCQCYVDAASTPRVAALGNAGFHQEGLLHSQLHHRGHPVDVAIYSQSLPST